MRTENLIRFLCKEFSYERRKMFQIELIKLNLTQNLRIDAFVLIHNVISKRYLWYRMSTFLFWQFKCKFNGNGQTNDITAHISKFNIRRQLMTKRNICWTWSRSNWFTSLSLKYNLSDHSFITSWTSVMVSLCSNLLSFLSSAPIFFNLLDKVSVLGFFCDRVTLLYDLFLIILSI